MSNQFGCRFTQTVSLIAAASKINWPKSFWLLLFLLGGATAAQAIIPASERKVLLDLYASTNGPGWANATGWGGALGTECRWHGISCAGNAFQENVVLITLDSNNLAGNLPSLSGLTALRSFFAFNNQLTGSIPSLSGLTALQIFNVGNNKLRGTVPAPPRSLLASKSNLCRNSLTSSGNLTIDADWVTAAGNWLDCQAAVTPNTFLLTVTKAGTGVGNVTGNTGDIACGATCNASLNSGTSVTLTATPSGGSYFSGWKGDCSGPDSCVLTMSAARKVTAIFKPKPFLVTIIKNFTATSATITTTVAFNAADVGKSGAVFVTSWAPANGLGALGVLTASGSQVMAVTTTRNSPSRGGELKHRQETLAVLLAESDPNAFVLVQLTASGWQLVINGQLVPYVAGVLGDALSALNILDNTNPSNLPGAQFCVGYGSSAAEMIAAGRMMPVATLPGAIPASNGSCNVADVVVEFYNANLDNYFITADADEATQIDHGNAGPGWSRTGNTFKSGGSASVCRFYGSYSPGPNSHFYTVDAAECQSLKDQQISADDPRKLTDKSWNFESLDFVSAPPATAGINGTCSGGTAPVYRAYNNGFARSLDSNHRITSSLSAIQEVVARGWSDEGVVMCAPN